MEAKFFLKEQLLKRYLSLNFSFVDIDFFKFNFNVRSVLTGFQIHYMIIFGMTKENLFYF